MKQINNLPDKEFKALIIATLTEREKIIDKQGENFNEKLENIKYLYFIRVRAEE